MTLMPANLMHSLRVDTGLEGPQKLAAILSKIVSKLATIDRYEQRALSKRKFAIREFAAVRR